MLREIKLVIKENNKVLESVTKETGIQPSELVTTLQEFQQSANAALSMMIESSGDSGTIEASDEEESEEEDSVPVTPKKRKK